MNTRTPWIGSNPQIGITSLAGITCIVSGLVTLLGWLPHLDFLRGLIPGPVAMNPLTAICFVGLGGALLILARSERRWGHRLLIVSIGVVVALAAGGKLLDIAFGSNLGFDQVLFRSQLDQPAIPNRMAPNTAIALFLAGLSIASASSGSRTWGRFCQMTALGPLFISALACIGYAYDATSFYGLPKFIPMALSTALTMAALSVGILALTREGIMRVIVADDAGGSMARRLLPLAILVPAVFGWVELQVQLALRYDAQSGNSILVVASALTSMAFIWATARSLGLSDAERRRAADSLRESNRSLENRVLERTHDLARTIRKLEAEIEERKRAEEALRLSEDQLRQSQKMEAVGRLAGGVAHDFNNLLTAILGYSQLMRVKLQPSDPLRSDTEEIEKAAVRAASLTRQLLAFSHQQILQPKVLDLNDVVTDMERMLRRLVRANIHVVTAPAANLGRVKADPGQLEQVILNLVVNAGDAMPNGGRLTIETANCDVDELYSRGRTALPPGRYVILAVTDSGCGMDESVRSRIFEPFFTTKEVGEGTGLGLSTVHGIVKQSGGHVEVYSELGHGSVFKVYLPRVEAKLDARATVDLSGPPVGSETILLVEDEDLVRSAVREMLISGGYKVIEAVNGDDGLRVWQARSNEIDLVVTDVIMPNVGGPELAERVTSQDAAARILFMSGYTDRAIVHQGVLNEGTQFLQKPFTTAALLHKVRAILDAPGSRAA